MSLLDVTKRALSSLAVERVVMSIRPRFVERLAVDDSAEAGVGREAAQRMVKTAAKGMILLMRCWKLKSSGSGRLYDMLEDEGQMCWL